MEEIQAAGEMDVEAQTAAAGGGTGDRTDLQIKAGLLPDTMERAETAQEMQVHRTPHPLNQPQSTGCSNLRGGERGIESIPSEAWRMPPQGDGQAVGGLESIRQAGKVNSKG